jgi:dephospho-CoA kinase
MEPKSNIVSSRGLRLGLTGGMGCGKSTVASFFRELGFAVLESDALVRELWEQDADVQNAAMNRWGGGIKAETKNSKTGLAIDRRKVAEIVFANSAELEWVEGLLHPKVGVRWQAALEAAPDQNWVVEIPLLFEKSLASRFDLTLCVWASPATQVQRLAQRGLSPTEMAARQARQWPLQDKAERADLVVSNDGSSGFLRRQVEWLAARFHRPSP